jgi:hypothetical protein
MVGFCAAALASQAQAQQGAKPYATAGEWEVAIEPGAQLCKMYRFYGSVSGKETEGLIVRYDASNEAVLLTWTTQKMALLPNQTGDLELFMNFVKGDKFDEKWGGLDFRFNKTDDTHYLTHRFTGARDAERFLRDLAENEIIGFDLGPVMMSALFLEAGEATRQLRECAVKVAGPRPQMALAK